LDSVLRFHLIPETLFDACANEALNAAFVID
jgi:hypothetical protein